MEKTTGDGKRQTEAAGQRNLRAMTKFGQWTKNVHHKLITEPNWGGLKS